MTVDVFISYAHPDRAEAARLASLLEQHGLSVWWDKEILGGDTFRREIRAKIDAARKVVVLWSPHSVSDRHDFVWDEADLAKEQKKLVPCAIGGIGRKEIPLGYGQLHTIMIASWERELHQVLTALGHVSQMDTPLGTAVPDLAAGPPAPLPVMAPPAKPSTWQRVLGRFAGQSAEEDQKLAAGRSLYAQSRWAEALDAFSAVIAAQPGSGAAYQHRAETLSQLGRWSDCLEDCKRAHERATLDDTAALMLGGGALLHLGVWDEAAAWYGAALARNDRLAAAYAWRAYAHVQTKSWQAALADVDAALRLDRDLPEPHWIRGYIMVGLNESEKAIDWLSAAIRRFPDLALAYYARAFAHANLSGWPEAEADCAQALKLLPTLPDAHWLRGYSRLQRASPDTEAALGDFTAAVQLKPDYEQAIHALLWTLVQRASWLGVLDESDRVLAQAVARASAGAPGRNVEEVAREVEHVVLSPRVRSLRAEAHRMLRNWKECIKECGEALSQSPRLLDALRIRGLAYLQQNNIADAAQDFSRALSIDPNDALALCWRGAIHRLRRDYAAALADLDRAIALQPALAIAYYQRGWTYLAIADAAPPPEPALERAHTDFSTLVQLAKKSGEGYAGLAEIARRRKQVDVAVNQLARAEAVEPDLAQTHLVNGWVQLDRKQWDAAAASFAAVLSREPGSAHACYGLGEAARGGQRWAEALSHYADTLRHDPQMTAAYTMRAAIHVDLCDFAGAIEDYGDAIRTATDLGLHDTLAECRAGRAWAHFEVGNDAAALADIQAAADLAPASGYVLEQWGNMLGFMGRWSDALVKFERALEVGGEQASFLISRALAHAYLGSLDAALADVERAIALEGKDSSRLNLRGWTCNLKGAWSDADEALSEAIALEPTHDFAHANRAYARWRMGDRAAARADLDRVTALALEDGKRAEPRRSRMLTYAWRVIGEGWSRAAADEPDEPVARYGRAVCHWLAGDLDDARAEWAAAVAKGLAASGPGALATLARAS